MSASYNDPRHHQDTQLTGLDQVRQLAEWFTAAFGEPQNIPEGVDREAFLQVLFTDKRVEVAALVGLDQTANWWQIIAEKMKTSQQLLRGFGLPLDSSPAELEARLEEWRAENIRLLRLRDDASVGEIIDERQRHEQRLRARHGVSPEAPIEELVAAVSRQYWVDTGREAGMPDPENATQKDILEYLLRKASAEKAGVSGVPSWPEIIEAEFKSMLGEDET